MNEPGSPQPIRIDVVWTGYTPPAQYAVDVAFPGIFTGSQTYQLTDLGGTRTRVEIASRIHYTSWFTRLLEPLVTPSATRKLEQDLGTLKTQVEQSGQ